MKVVRTFFLIGCCFPIFLLAQIDSLLLQSIKENNLAQVDSLLQTEIAINAVDEHGANALMWAVYKADLSIVKHLINKGAAIPEKAIIQLPNESYGNLTGIAAGEGKLDLLKYLIDTLHIPIDEKEYNMETDTTDGWTALQWGAAKDRPAIVEYLISEKADIVIAIEQLVEMYRTRGAYPKALSLTQEVVEIIKKSNGEKHSNYGIALNFLAILYQDMGNYEAALPLFLKIKEIVKNNLGINHSDYGTALNNLARLHQDMGNYEAALPLFLEDSEITKNSLGIKHPYYAISLNSLASLYNTMGNYEAALPLFLESLEIIENSLGKHHQYYSFVLSNLTTLYQYTGNYEAALPLLLEVLETRKKILGITHPDYGKTLNNLARLYQIMGDYKAALPHYLKSLEIIQNSFGMQHPNYGLILNNLARLYHDMGDYKAALPHYLKALEVKEKSTIKDSDYGFILNNLARLYHDMGDYKAALPLFLKDLKITENNFGKEHPDYGAALHSLARLYHDMDDYEAALLGFEEALKVKEKTLGKQHLSYGASLNSLAILYQDMENDKAFSIYLELAKNLSFNLQKHLPYLPEKLQLSSQATYKSKIDQINSFFIDRILPDSIYQLNTQFKGLTVRNLMTLQQGDTISNKLVSLKRRIGTELSKPTNKRSKYLSEWETEALTLESSIMSERILTNELINIDTLRSSLASDEIIIDIHHFNYYTPDKTDSIYYVAYIIDPLQGNIQQEFLFEEKELISLLNKKSNPKIKIDHLYAKRGTLKEEELPTIYEYQEDIKEDGVVTKDSTNIYDLIWKPLQAYLTNKKIIHLSSSGLLHKINHSAIPISTDSAMLDKFEIVNYTNISDLLYKQKAFTTQDYLLIGGINYDSTITIDKNNPFDILPNLSDTLQQRIVLGVSKSRSILTDRWEHLPGTDTEVDTINNLFKKAGGWQGEKWKGIRAPEKSLKKRLMQKKSPQILHIASHAFSYDLVEDSLVTAKNVFKTANDAMRRSGIILSGGNIAWQGKAVKQGEEDGILTAYEVQNLNLRNTELAVLSACETGLGEIKGNEGVFGLQRAFKIAGVQYLIMSLWQVPDQQTAIFMSSFYRHWLEDHLSIRAAFHQTQKEMKDKFADAYNWAGFILME